MSPRVALADLLAGLPGEARAIAGVVTGIAIDSRHVRPGDLFVALPGEHTHGKRFVADALARGAVAVLVPPETDLPPSTPAFLTPDPGQLLAIIAARFYGQPAETLRLHGVTGTNGKTTTALLLHHLLTADGRKSAAWTTARVTVGDTLFRPKWTTPPAHELHRFLAAASARGARDVVLEVSSHAIQQGRVAGLAFATAVATNVSPDHLDYHGDFGRYLAAKRSFVADLPPEAIAFLNAEDPYVRTFADVTAATVVRYGFDPTLDLFATDVVSGLDGTAFRAHVRSGALPGAAALDLALTTSLPGRHNVLNALAALGAALAAGVSPAAAADALRRFPRPPRRLELHRFGPYTVLNDVAMNEASYETVFTTIAEAGLSAPVVVHALRGQRGAALNARLAVVLARWARRLSFSPLIASLSEDVLARYPLPYQVSSEEQEAFLRAAAEEGLVVHLHRTLADAIAEGVARLTPQRVLVLLGTFGMDDGPRLAGKLLAERAGLDTVEEPRYPGQEDEPGF